MSVKMLKLSNLLLVLLFTNCNCIVSNCDVYTTRRNYENCLKANFAIMNPEMSTYDILYRNKSIGFIRDEKIQPFHHELIKGKQIVIQKTNATFDHLVCIYSKSDLTGVFTPFSNGKHYANAEFTSYNSMYIPDNMQVTVYTNVGNEFYSSSFAKKREGSPMISFLIEPKIVIPSNAIGIIYSKKNFEGRFIPLLPNMKNICFDVIHSVKLLNESYSILMHSLNGYDQLITKNEMILFPLNCGLFYFEIHEKIANDVIFFTENNFTGNKSGFSISKTNNFTRYVFSEKIRIASLILPVGYILIMFDSSNFVDPSISFSKNISKMSMFYLNFTSSIIIRPVEANENIGIEYPVIFSDKYYNGRNLELPFGNYKCKTLSDMDDFCGYAYVNNRWQEPKSIFVPSGMKVTITYQYSSIHYIYSLITSFSGIVEQSFLESSPNIQHRGIINDISRTIRMFAVEKI